jgi:hypothetical protein
VSDAEVAEVPYTVLAPVDNAVRAVDAAFGMRCLARWRIVRGGLAGALGIGWARVGQVLAPHHELDALAVQPLQELTDDLRLLLDGQHLAVLRVVAHWSVLLAAG